MALYNEILVGRWNKFLAKMLSMKGNAPAPQLAGEISPGFVLFLGVENRALESWYRFGIASIVVNGGATQKAVRLRNPLTSNRLVVLEKITCCGLGALVDLFTLETATTNTDLGGAVTLNANVSWDKRLNVGSSLFQSSQTAPPALSLGRETIQLLGNTPWNFILEEQHEQVLSPGEAIQVRGATAAQDIAVGYWWRERAFEESEVSL